MDFSTKAIAEISGILAEENGKHIEAEEISNLYGLENGIREVVKEIGCQTYGKVVESEDEKLGRRIKCECGMDSERISKRDAKVLTVFGWVSYGCSYYGCS